MTIQKPKLELLSPVGDPESLDAALRFGADAVFLGGSFLQLRASAAGFSDEKLAKAAKKVHAAGKKLYVTVNSFAYSHEIPQVGDYVRFLKDCGVDAIIVSDIGVLAEAKACCPEMEVHISTQANTMNYRAAQVYYDMGATRVVLARELSLEEIMEFRARAPKDLEMEAFVHGAMCMSYSGRCLISAYLTGRSGNRGECAQPCRWSYHLEEEKRPGEYFPIEEDEHGTTILSSRDMCALPLIKQLAEAGIISFKIEGRMKSPFYIASVTNAYRMALDGTGTFEDAAKELCSISHRPYTAGFYIGQPGSPEDLASLGDLLVSGKADGEYVRECTFVATAAADSAANGLVPIVTRNFFRLGDTLEVLSPGRPGIPFTLEYMENAEGQPMEKSNQPLKTVFVRCPFPVKEGDLLRMRK